MLTPHTPTFPRRIIIDSNRAFLYFLLAHTRSAHTDRSPTTLSNPLASQSSRAPAGVRAPATIPYIPRLAMASEGGEAAARVAAVAPTSTTETTTTPTKQEQEQGQGQQPSRKSNLRVSVGCL